MGVTQEAPPTAPAASAPPPPPQVTTIDLWSLRASPATLSETAQAWRDLATGARTSARTVNDAAGVTLRNGWEGDTAETYDDHRRRLTKDVSELAKLALSGARALDEIADTLATTQGLLADEWDALTATVPAARYKDGTVSFSPVDAAGTAAVSAAAARARSIRAELDDALVAMVAAFERLRTDLDAVSRAWQAVVAGTTEPFELPPEALGPAVIMDGDRMIVYTGRSDDIVRVERNPFTGELTVVIYRAGPFGPQEVARYPVPEGSELTIRAGEGNDTIEVPAGTPISVTVLGGEGDDRIITDGGADVVLAGAGDDTVEAGAGDDRVSGGAGQDYLSTYTGDDRLTGGLGADTLYGGSGQDQLSGGRGDDYLEGGRGGDSLAGGAGGDVLSGGRGDDRIAGGAGDDTVYTGRGEDTVFGGSDGSAGDVVYGQLHADEASVFGIVVDEEGADTIDGAERVVHVEILGSPGSTIEVSGSDEFRERVADDLDMLASSPNGRLMLTELDQVSRGSDGAFGYSNDHVSIVELDEQNGRAGNDQNVAEWLLGHDTYKIQYNPTFDDFRGGPASVVLYHEMAHVYDYDNDTRLDGRYENPADPDTTPVFETDDFEVRGGVPNAERQAAGLPVDRDGDGTFEIDPEHPFEYTENGLREEMRVPPRTTYGEPEPYGVVPIP